MGAYDTTLGPLVVGIFLNTFLYGLVTYQFVAYYRASFDDRPAIKYMVLFLFILDTFSSISAIYMAWHYTVTNFHNPRPLEFKVAIWPCKFTPVSTALAAFITQLFLGYRIWRLTNKKVVYGVAIVLAIISFVLGILYSVEAWTLRGAAELACVKPIVIAWSGAQVMVDMFITVTLITVFHSSRTGFRKIDTVLNRLICGALQTGFLSVVFSISILVTFLALPRTNFYSIFIIPLGRIHTNTLMDSLLARKSIKASLAETVDAEGVTGPVRWARGEPSSDRSTVLSTSIRVEVQMSVHETHDHAASEDAEDKEDKMVSTAV